MAKIDEKKRVETRYGNVSISKEHLFSKVLQSQRLSPYYRELMIYLGQLDCYESASEIINKLLRIQTNDTQVFRQTTDMGTVAASMLEEEISFDLREETEQIYVQVDGSMLLTREEKWKEVKVGRVFCGSAVYEENQKRGWIKESHYVAHLGGHELFEMKMCNLIDSYSELGKRLVFVTDGASWIRSWVNADYPEALQILDFYHAMEHLAEFARHYFKDELERDYWIEENRMRLKEKGVREVIKHIKKLQGLNSAQQKEQARLINYYESNAYRMNYREYIEQGLIIGSGAIEAAHRTLVQKRMKLSGQRWSKQGAQKMLDLRALHMSGRWNQVVNLLRKAA